jgi:TRAP-type C4-dicarboxylate transport system substrate-binding protein
MKTDYRKMALVFVMIFGVLFATRAFAASDKPIEINHATEHALASIDGKIVVEWFAEIDKRTSGRVKGTVFPGGALGKGPDILNLIKSGSAGSGTILGINEIGDFSNAPFKVSNALGGTALAYELYHKGYLDKFLGNTKLMFMTSTALFHLFTAKKPVNKLEDVKGMKIRAASPQIATTVKALGGVPVSLSPSEIYMAMERGTIDGLITSMGLLHGAKLYDVVKYALWEPLGTGPLMNIMNTDLWNKIPGDDKAIIEQVNHMMMFRYVDYHTDLDHEGLAFLKNKGLKINNLSAAERAKWEKVTWEAQEKSLKEAWKARGLPADELMKELVGVSDRYK